MARKFFYVCAGMLLLVLSYHFGAASTAAAGFPEPSEVATLSGELPDGGTIPLPVYADGSTASEAECRWIVSPRTFLVQYSGYVYCYSTGRVVHVVSQGGQNDPATVANYMIIASRLTSLPTGAQRETWSQAKARYAPTGGTVSKGADTK